MNSFFAILLFSSVLVVPNYSYADSVINIKLDNPLKNTSNLTDFMDHLLTGITFLLTPVVVVMFLWTGFLFVKAQGVAEEITKARDALMYTLIGAALVLGAKGLSEVIRSTISKLN